MAKLRKMLGDIYDPVNVALRELIETQSGETLARWSIGYVTDYVLPIYEKAYPDEARVRKLLELSLAYVNGEVKLKEVKAMIKEVNQIAKEADVEPAAQAAVRAIATACSVTYSPTGALGYTFYTAAAIVYDKAGLEEKREIYDTMAAVEYKEILASLQAVAVEDEPNPVKVNWNC